MAESNELPIRPDLQGHEDEKLRRADVKREVEAEIALKLEQEALIRAEVRREVEEVLKARSGLFGWMNSPFGVATVGGVCVALITQSFLWTRSCFEHARDEQQRKADILASIANDFETSNSILLTVQSKKIWLKANASADARDPLGRSRNVVEAEFWDAWKLYAKTPKAEAAVAEVRAFFDSAEVSTAAVKLSAAVDDEYLARTDDELMAKREITHQLTDALTSAMCRDARPNKPCK